MIVLSIVLLIFGAANFICAGIMASNRNWAMFAANSLIGFSCIAIGISDLLTM